LFCELCHIRWAKREARWRQIETELQRSGLSELTIDQLLARK
jgi:hypothetical protein